MTTFDERMEIETKEMTAKERAMHIAYNREWETAKAEGCSDDAAHQRAMDKAWPLSDCVFD